MGTATNTTGLITTTPAYLLTTNRIWVDATPTTTVEPIASAAQNIITENIILTTTTEAIEGGIIKIIACWFPLTDNSTLIAT